MTDPTTPAPPEDTGMGFVAPLALGRGAGGRKSKAPGVELAITLAAAVLIFAGAFLDDPSPLAPSIMMFLDKLLMLIAVITAAAFFARRGPPGRWLGPAALLIIVGAWVAGGLLRDPIQKAGYFPMTSAAVMAEARDYMRDVMAQAKDFRAAAETGRPLPAARLSGRTSEAGRYVDALVLGSRAIAAEQSAFRAECGPYLELIGAPSRLASAGIAPARARLADCRASAARHRAGVMARIDALPGQLAVFRHASMNAYVNKGMADQLKAIRPDIERTWTVQIQILDVSSQQLDLLEHTRWSPQFGSIAFYREPDRLAFNDLVGKIDRLNAENQSIMNALATRRQDAMFQMGLGGY